MEKFVELINALDATTKTAKKITALKNYFLRATPADAAWAIHFLCGKKISRPVKTATFKQAAIEYAAITAWLFEDCYHIVGDLAETVALLTPVSRVNAENQSLHNWIEKVILPLKKQDDTTQIAILKQSWKSLTKNQYFVFNKLLTGNFRIGVSAQLVYRALSTISGIDVHIIAQRLMGKWQPTADFVKNLFIPLPATAGKDLQAVPLMLAHPLADPLTELGNLKDWLLEWKWDGIRTQVLIDQHGIHLWSRGDELITDRFPEIASALQHLPQGTLLDGEILAWNAQGAMPFQLLQQRIMRKSLSKKMLTDIPCSLMVFDILYHTFRDIRQEPLSTRRSILENLLPPAGTIQLSTLILEKDPLQLMTLQKQSRQQGAEGLMLKNIHSPYVMGRKRGLWWKWKIAPMTIDAVLVQAQRGHGRRANLFSDYTFAVWDKNELISFAKAYSGLSDQEMHAVDQFIKKNTLRRFGPVVTVKPELVFELAFEGIQPSKRHKAKVAVRFPRIIRWRKDKTLNDANTLTDLYDLLKLYEKHPSTNS